MSYPNKIENLPNKQETGYSISRSIQHMPGLAQMPSGGGAGDDALCLFVRLHQPYEVEVITWTAVCEGGPPVIPSPLDANLLGLGTNRIFLGSTIGATIPHPVGGVQVKYQWTLSGTYYYGKKAAEGPVNDIPLGKYPWQPQGVDDNYFPKENFVQNALSLDMPTPEIPLNAPIQGP